MATPQLPKVDCRFGAPMGRAEWSDDFTERCRCFRLRFIDGAYDEGSAYWGAPANVFCATNGDGFRKFKRAQNRNEAKAFFKEIHPLIKWVN